MTDMAKEGNVNFSRNHKLNALIEKPGLLLHLLQRFDKRKYKFFLRQMGIILIIFLYL